jgi:hypothetical protein
LTFLPATRDVCSFLLTHLGGLPFRHTIDISGEDPYGDLATRLGRPIRVCNVLKEAARPFFPDRVEGIKIGKKVRKLFSLHTSSRSGGTAGQLVERCAIRYTDGTTAREQEPTPSTNLRPARYREEYRPFSTGGIPFFGLAAGVLSDFFNFSGGLSKNTINISRWNIAMGIETGRDSKI